VFFSEGIADRLTEEAEENICSVLREFPPFVLCPKKGTINLMEKIHV
jgi:hypothetical protein